MTELAIRREPTAVLLPPIGLMLSIGAPGQPNKPGRPIHYFRSKTGALDQYADAAAKFVDVYGPEPTRLSDVWFLGDSPEQVLDVRLLAFSKSGLRLRGLTNYAQQPDPEAFMRAAYSFEDECVFYPREAKEVRPELRDDWQGEPIPGRLTGPDDPRVKKLDIRVVTSLSFLLPEVLGVGMRVVLSTGGRRSTRNFHAGVWTQYLAFHGLLGRPFRLTNRAARTQRFDPETRSFKPTEFRELVLDTPQTVIEIMTELRRVRAALGPAVERRALPAVTEAESHILAGALDLPALDVAAFDEVEDLTGQGEVMEDAPGGRADSRPDPPGTETGGGSGEQEPGMGARTPAPNPADDGTLFPEPDAATHARARRAREAGE